MNFTKIFVMFFSLKSKIFLLRRKQWGISSLYGYLHYTVTFICTWIKVFFQCIIENDYFYSSLFNGPKRAGPNRSFSRAGPGQRFDISTYMYMYCWYEQEKILGKREETRELYSIFSIWKNSKTSIEVFWWFPFASVNSILKEV